MSILKEYVEKLDGADETERIYAAEDIGYLNSPDGVPALLQRLRKDPSRAVRDAIFQALIRIDADASIEGSVRLLGSQDPEIRNQAVDVLRHKGLRSIPFLATLMRDSDKDIRKLVLDVLSGTFVSGAGEIYTTALSDEDPNVVITALENLGRMRAEEFRVRIENLLQADRHPMLIGACLDALIGIGNECSMAAIRRCFPDFATLPDFLLTSCLRAMGALGSAREFAEVANLLTVRQPHLRPAILSAMIAIYPRSQSPDPGEKLLAALRALIENDDSPLCRYQAVRVLGLWADRDEVCTVVVSYLSSAERLVRLAAAESLRITERPEVESVLAARALEESDEEVLQALSR